MRLVKFLFPGLFLLFSLGAFSQVFPGDADNSGTVNNVDVLYVGYAYGESGPSRLEENEEFALQFIPSLWGPSFPGGLNYAFADADGSGLIDFLDLLAIYSNYGQRQTGAGTTPNITGTPGVHPPMHFEREAVPTFITESTQFEVPLYLGSPENPVNDFNGLAFSLEYDSDLIQELSFDVQEESWIMESEDAFFFEAPNPEGENKVEAAFSRYGQNPVSGYGIIGKLSFIIQDDLIDFLPSGDSLDVTIRFKDIRMKNGDFWDVPVVYDSLTFRVFNPDIVASKNKSNLSRQVKAFPNPTKETLNIIAPVKINQVELFNTAGKKVLVNTIEHQKRFRIKQLDRFNPGIYFLKLYAEEGIMVKKLMLE